MISNKYLSRRRVVDDKEFSSLHCEPLQNYALVESPVDVSPPVSSADTATTVIRSESVAGSKPSGSILKDKESIVSKASPMVKETPSESIAVTPIRMFSTFF
jgi:hypothetical protein